MPYVRHRDCLRPMRVYNIHTCKVDTVLCSCVFVRACMRASVVVRVCVCVCVRVFEMDGTIYVSVSL